MSAKTFGLYSKNVVMVDGIREAVVLVAGSTISGIVDRKHAPAGIDIDDLGDSVLMPGLVDSHVHINEPGRTEWEGFETATLAAAAGGITTLAEMPLNSQPVTTTLPAFEQKREAASGKLWVDCAFWGGVVPGNSASLEPMIEAGVAGFKCFLIHSGIDDFPNVTESDLRLAMPILAKHRVPLLVHAELECVDFRHERCKHESGAGPGEEYRRGGEHKPESEPGSGSGLPVPYTWDDARSYRQFLQSRPRQWEDDAIALMLELCQQYNCSVHIVHLSSAGMVPAIRSARARALPFTVETCPHYLTFAAEEIADGDTRFKCAPPIRERDNREALWAALQERSIDMVVSDHSPCLPALKFLPEGDLKKAWGGISSLQFRLPAVWAESKKRGFTLNDMAVWLCEAPAALLGLSDRKGRIAAGYDADFVIWNQHEPSVFYGDHIYHRHKVTPYEGRQLLGLVEQTYLHGRKIWQNGRHLGVAAGEQLLRRENKLSKR